MSAATTTLSSSSYIPLKDTSQVLSNVEHDFVRSCAFANINNTNNSNSNIIRKGTIVRLDGRHGQELRPARLVLTRMTNQASGLGGEASSATVQWGFGTRVTCTCHGELVVPVDRPNEGTVQISVDLSPGASTAFRQAAPVTTATSVTGGGGSGGGSSSMEAEQKLLSNRILRCIERVLLLGNALDVEALCVQPGQWVWKLSLAVTVLDAAGGNLLDASVLASMAALRHYRRPHVQMTMDSSTSTTETSASSPTLIPSDWKEATPLPLHHTPLSVSFALFEGSSLNTTESSSSNATNNSNNNRVALLVDPDAREELVMNGVLTLAMNVHGELLLLDFGGGCELPSSSYSASNNDNQQPLLRQCHDLAAKLIPQLCRQLEDSLSAADHQAREERLQRLQRQQQQQQQQLANFELPPLPAPVAVPGEYDYDSSGVGEQLIAADAAQSDAMLRQAETEAEEAYRRQALDYNLGHAPVPVREDDKDDNDNPNDGSSSSSRPRRKGQASSSKTTAATVTNSLLAFMLESVRQQGEEEEAEPGFKTDVAAVSSKTADVAPKMVRCTALASGGGSSSTSSKPPPPEKEEDDPTKDDPMEEIMDNDNDEAKRLPPLPQVPSAPPPSLHQQKQQHDGRLDSDEEDVTMQLESEYTTTTSSSLLPGHSNTATATSTSTKHGPSPAATAAAATTPSRDEDIDGDDDVDDLAAAIKKKKKKKTKKK